MDFIDKEQLYGNKYNALVLCEYTRDLELIKSLINIADEAVEKKKGFDIWSLEGVCHSFAKTIVDYSKMAYDNLMLGHFDATHMINRSILENRVCMEIIMDNEEYELWKYYLAYSYKNEICNSDEKLTQWHLSKLEEKYKEFEISGDFYVKQNGRKKPYIKEPYGWTYKINKHKQFNFAGICELLDESGERLGFKLMSSYSHGTSLYKKMQSSTFVGNMMCMLVSLYIELYIMITSYCWDMVDEEFDEISEEFETIAHRYIEYEERHFGG